MLIWEGKEADTKYPATHLWSKGSGGTARPPGQEGRCQTVGCFAQDSKRQEVIFVSLFANAHSVNYSVYSEGTGHSLGAKMKQGRERRYHLSAACPQGLS